MKMMMMMMSQRWQPLAAHHKLSTVYAERCSPITITARLQSAPQRPAAPLSAIVQNISRVPRRFPLPPPPPPTLCRLVPVQDVLLLGERSEVLPPCLQPSLRPPTYPPGELRLAAQHTRLLRAAPLRGTNLACRCSEVHQPTGLGAVHI